MNLDIITLYAAQNRTAHFAREALPDSPVIADVGIGPRVGRIVRIRANLSGSLYALAGHISPDIDNSSGRSSAIAPPGNTLTPAC